MTVSVTQLFALCISFIIDADCVLQDCSKLFGCPHIFQNCLAPAYLVVVSLHFRLLTSRSRTMYCLWRISPSQSLARSRSLRCDGNQIEFLDSKLNSFAQDMMSGPIFMKGLSQGLDLNLLFLYWTFKSKPWLSPL